MARTTIQGSFLGLASQAAGDVMYFDGTNWIRLAKGSADEVLTMGASAPEWEVAGGGAVAWEGGNTTGAGWGGNTSNNTEATTTSTSVVDILSASSLTIAGAQPFQITAVARKTTGASGGEAKLGYKENTTVIWAANSSSVSAGLWRSSTANEAQNGSVDTRFSARATNYLHGKGTGLFMNYTTAGAYVDARFTHAYAGYGSEAVNVAMSTGQITSFTINGISANTANTLGVDEYHIYSFAIS